jgi:hypothetical protein
MADSIENDNPNSKPRFSDSLFSDEMLKLAQCLMPEPPSDKVKLVGGAIVDKKIDRQIHEIGWKAYDSVVGAANNATNRIFTSPPVGQVLGGAIDVMLRWQRLNVALAGAFFSALWPAVGLPSATEVEGLRREVRAMREEIRDAVAERDAKDDFASQLHLAIRDSVVNQQAAENKSAARQSDGDGLAAAPTTTTAKRSGAYQFSVWAGWPGAEPMEQGKDVGN